MSYAEKSTSAANDRANDRAVPRECARFEEHWASWPDRVQLLEHRLDSVLRPPLADPTTPGPRSVHDVSLAGWIADRTEALDQLLAKLSDIIERIEL
jgi:hypothetical protein